MKIPVTDGYETVTCAVVCSNRQPQGVACLIDEAGFTLYAGTLAAMPAIADLCQGKPTELFLSPYDYNGFCRWADARGFEPIADDMMTPATKH